MRVTKGTRRQKQSADGGRVVCLLPHVLQEEDGVVELCVEEKGELVPRRRRRGHGKGNVELPPSGSKRREEKGDGVAHLLDGEKVGAVDGDVAHLGKDGAGMPVNAALERESLRIICVPKPLLQVLKLVRLVWVDVRLCGESCQSLACSSTAPFALSPPPRPHWRREQAQKVVARELANDLLPDGSDHTHACRPISNSLQGAAKREEGVEAGK